MNTQPTTKIEEAVVVSGAREASVLPAELEGFNWGAFFLTWIWGIGNNSIKTILFGLLISIFPITNIVLGLKGNKWAWQNKHWNSIEEFKSTQKTWAIVGLVLTLLMIPVMIFWIGILSAGILGAINPEAKLKQAQDMTILQNSMNGKASDLYRDTNYTIKAEQIFTATETYFAMNGKYPFEYKAGARVDVAEFLPKLVESKDLLPNILQHEAYTSSDTVGKIYAVVPAKLVIGDELRMCFTSKSSGVLSPGSEICVPKE